MQIASCKLQIESRSQTLFGTAPPGNSVSRDPGDRSMRLFPGNARVCLAIAVGIGLLFALGGCRTRRPGASGHSWTSGSVPELKSAASKHTSPDFEFFRWWDGLTILIVEDVRGFSFARGSGDNYHWEYAVDNDHGLRFECQVDTTDGKTATFRIDDKEYDLSEGTLFVIKAKDDKVEVHQLNRDLAALPFDSAAIRTLLKNDAEVRKIFGVKDEDK